MTNWLVVSAHLKKMKVNWDDAIPNGKSLKIPWFQSPPSSQCLYAIIYLVAGHAPLALVESSTRITLHGRPSRKIWCKFVDMMK
jgi:hypothetical protein